MSKRNQLRMPFGKHKGQPLSSIDIGYLQWAVATFDDGSLKVQIENELESRSQRQLNAIEANWLKSRSISKADRKVLSSCKETK